MSTRHAGEPPLELTRPRDVEEGSARVVSHLRVLPSNPQPASEPPDQAELYRRYAPYVATIGIRILGRDHELDDLVQDTFLQALRGLSNLREPAAIKGWLARITVRLAVKRLRRRRLLRLLHLDADTKDYERLTTSEATPEQRALVGRVYQILDGLSPNDRVVWILRHVEGEQLQRIPELCGCSLSTAQRRLRRAQEAVERGLSHE